MIPKSTTFLCHFSSFLLLSVDFILNEVLRDKLSFICRLLICTFPGNPQLAKKRAGLAAIAEALMEAGPQMVLQASIIVKLGYASKKVK